MTATVTGITRRQDWRRTAACRDADPALFFGPDIEPADKRDAREAAAKAVCATCPVRARAACLALAIGTFTKHGVWGGMTEAELERHARNVRDRARKAAEREAAA